MITSLEQIYLNKCQKNLQQYLTYSFGSVWKCPPNSFEGTPVRRTNFLPCSSADVRGRKKRWNEKLLFIWRKMTLLQSYRVQEDLFNNGCWFVLLSVSLHPHLSLQTRLMELNFSFSPDDSYSLHFKDIFKFQCFARRTFEHQPGWTLLLNPVNDKWLETGDL